MSSNGFNWLSWKRKKNQDISLTTINGVCMLQIVGAIAFKPAGHINTHMQVNSVALSFMLSISDIWLLISLLRKVWLKTSVYTEIHSYLHIANGVLISYIMVFFFF